MTQHRWRTTGAMAGLLACAGLGLGAPGAHAQRFGQWWWDGELAYSDRSNEREPAQGAASASGERSPRISLGLNGYLGHPALGRFRLGLEAARFDLTGDGELGSTNLGYSAALDLMPRGPYPLFLDFRHGSYDYSVPRGAAAFSLATYPSEATTAGARLRMRRGPLKGTLLGYDLTEVAFTDPATGEERRSRGFLEWARSLGAFDNRLSIGRETNDYSRVGFATDVATASFDQQAQLAEVWNWNLSLRGLSTEVRFGESPPQTLDDYRLSWNLRRDLKDRRDLVDVRLDAGLARPGTGTESRGYGAAVFYRWHPRPGAEVAPFVQVAELEADAGSSSIARGGVAASWSRAGRRFDGLISGQASLGTVSRGASEPAPGESQSAWSVAASLGHGVPAKLREEIEVEAGRNELRLSRAADPLDPAQGALAAAIGAEDYARARVRVHHAAGVRLGAWVDWSTRRSELASGAGMLERDDLNGTLEAGYHAVSLLASVGTSTATATFGEQEVGHLTGTLTWRPWRFLGLSAGYREDERRFTGGIDLHGERIDATLTFELARLSFSASAYEMSERVAGGAASRYRGISWGIRRGFAGWLPIVTGARRRGEIR